MYEASVRSKVTGGKPLRVSVLLDFMRGSRGVKNSRTMLLPLVKDFTPAVTVALYHTPELRGIARQLLPERYNETLGVNHIKAYVFDDTVVISG
jgi:CDP-diacylglycerol--glycerol-3-phosphate 3-phosphatidyltransferase